MNVESKFIQDDLLKIKDFYPFYSLWFELGREYTFSQSNTKLVRNRVGKLMKLSIINIKHLGHLLDGNFLFPHEPYFSAAYGWIFTFHFVVGWLMQPSKN